MSIIIASGLRIYFLRRNQKGLSNRKLESAWEAVVWGTPLVLSTALLLAIASPLEGLGLVLLFWLGMVFVIAVAAFIAKPIKVRESLKILCGMILLAIVLIHGFINIGNALSVAAYIVSAVLLAIAGSISLPTILRLRQQTGPTELAAEQA